MGGGIESERIGEEHGGGGGRGWTLLLVMLQLLLLLEGLQVPPRKRCRKEEHQLNSYKPLSPTVLKNDHELGGRAELSSAHVMT